MPIKSKSDQAKLALLPKLVETLNKVEIYLFNRGLLDMDGIIDVYESVKEYRQKAQALEGKYAKT